jgi:hypothetical protein
VASIALSPIKASAAAGGAPVNANIHQIRQFGKPDFGKNPWVNMPI